jgi:hypothetical protein
MHTLGYSAIAVLCNNPKHLKRWFDIMPYRFVAVCDNDENKAGLRLSTYTDNFILLPPDEDANSVDKEWLRSKLLEF